VEIPADDRGFTLGDGLFETLLAVDGQLVNADAHVARLHRGCEALGLPKPAPIDCWAAAEDALEAAGSPARAAVRITLTAGSGGRGLDRPETPARLLVATATAARPPGRPLRLLTSPIRRNDHSPTSRLKTLSYLDSVLARREAQLRGSEEALMLNTRGELASAAAANLFWIEGKQLFTPALDCGVLDGTIRAALIERDGVHEVRAAPEVLAKADALYLTNSLMGVTWVQSLDGRAFQPHPRGRDLQSLVADLVPAA
jgi:branched-chain amino acid aminotransferase/4-amino-4-deoxychorismate lyase